MGEAVLDPLEKSASEPEKQAQKKSIWSDLMVRFVSGIVLAVAAFAVTWWGGVAYALFFGAVSVLIYREWLHMVGEAPFQTPAMAGYISILGSLFCFHFGDWQAGLAIPVFGAGYLFFARCSYRIARWCALGILYAAAFGGAMLLLRQDIAFGFAAILMLFALVWGTDVSAYFVGKYVGGPKLWPRVSPKKTWSGSIGGLVLGTGFSVLVALILGISLNVPLIVTLGALSVFSQLGDLAESQMKRMFDVKDSGTLIPGHGGVMDRVDGLLFAVVAAAVIGFFFADIHSLATGFLIQ
ncbi:phosphatidate cytidylyltransferase [uncultured Cohaesibacter sp.]|uniref:phosphatidate cytidylyltransferase n=1 Tax=uncultured Cohaesibacter sp. TaxID=1002546 RepID=UPI0029C77811|nr:phosphatidate cytidylyltransferase [uncultured Cohaesibacter sp.]